VLVEDRLVGPPVLHGLMGHVDVLLIVVADEFLPLHIVGGAVAGVDSVHVYEQGPEACVDALTTGSPVTRYSPTSRRGAR
jgi:hypothetical protein